MISGLTDLRAGRHQHVAAAVDKAGDGRHVNGPSELCTKQQGFNRGYYMYLYFLILMKKFNWMSDRV